jgi:hypothetical protein
MNIVSWIQMRFQSAIQGLSSMKSIPYMADTLPTGLVQTKKADETLDRQTEKIRGRIRSPITYTLPLCPLILSMQTSK